jgi:hypothetical protein
MVSSVLGDDHRAIVEVADPLALLLAPLEELDRKKLARQDDRLHRVGQIVEVDDVDALEFCDLVEIVIVGHDPAPQVLGQHDKPLVDLADSLEVRNIRVVDADLDPGRLLQAIEHIEPAAAPIAPYLVGAVGDSLKLLENEPWDD